MLKSSFKNKGINDEVLNTLIDTYKSELEKLYPDNPFLYWDGILSDSTFKIPIVRVLEAMVNFQPNIYYYMFSYKSPKFGFALHTFEIPFVFNTIDKFDVAEGAVEVSEDSRRLTKIMMDTWLAFARSGHPDNDNLPSWPAYDLEKRVTMKLSINPEVIETAGDPLYKIWEGIL